MTVYEMMVIISPGLGEKNTSDQLDQIRNMITSSGGEILNEDIDGMRTFAYRIKKFDEGYYAVFNFSMDGEKVKEFEYEFNINQAVLRYLITKTPKHYEFRTLAEYDEELEKAAKEKQAEKDAKQQQQHRPAVRKPVKELEQEQEKKKPEEKKAEPKEKDTKEKAEEKLEKVDEKLKSIIDDPDIKL